MYKLGELEQNDIVYIYVMVKCKGLKGNLSTPQRKFSAVPREINENKLLFFYGLKAKKLVQSLFSIFC